MHQEGDRAVRAWLTTALGWFPVFTTFGFLLAIKFLEPTFLTDTAWLTFGRLRPAHVNGVALGLLSSGLIASMLYVLPRVIDTPLRFPRLARYTAYAWNLAVLGGIVAILAGYSQGREYAELPWVVDVLVMLCLAALATVVFGSLKARRERKLYVSAWYYAGTMLWFPVVYFVGNVMWHVPSGALSGTIDGIFNWYYGHNILGLWFTTLAIPAWYYFVPKYVKRPLYSHLLSLIAFFSIAFFYTGVGEHHLLQAPIPEWLRTEAVIMSALMAVPVVTFATNILLTMRGSHRPLFADKTFLFVIAGFWMYVLTSLQGSFQAFRQINQFVHFSQWPVAHAHLALLGGMGFLVVGLAFKILPEVAGTRLWSRKLLDTTWWVAGLGFLTFFSGMTIAGLVQNSSWAAQVQIVPTLPMLPVHFLVRAIGGGMVVVAAYMFAVNLGMTLLKGGEHHTAVEPHALPEGAAQRTHSPFQRRSQERISLPVLIVGGLSLFGLMTFMVVGMGAMFGGSEPTDRAHELTAEELKGQTLYRENGCFYCHSQFVRTSDWAVGVPSEAGDFYYSSPNFLGTERTGPTLGQIGGMRPTMWLHDHYVDPRMVEPRSIMPSFAWLPSEDIDALDAYVQHLGGKNLELRAFQAQVPAPYDTAVYPYEDLVMKAMRSYDASEQAFTGDAGTGLEYETRFEAGKVLHVQRCLSCHGCSGNGQGPYARTLVARPANIVERISNYPGMYFHFWRISEGVPGTAMPPWKLSLTEEERWTSALYEDSLKMGAVRVVDGGVSDDAAKQYAAETGARPTIAGTQAEWDEGKALYELYCMQCHGEKGEGDGPASSTVPGGYIKPEPAVFPETGHDFEAYGQYVWKVREGVPTTHMPPWKYALSEDEITLAIFYIQTLAEPADYDAKWGPLYSDAFARDFAR